MTIATKLFLASGVAAICTSILAAQPGAMAPAQPILGARSAKTLTIDGYRFKDLNRDGALNPYEDWRLSPAARAADLTTRLTLEEKAGIMMHGIAPTKGSEIGFGDRYDMDQARKMIIDAKVTAFITRLAGNPEIMAEENNKLQAIAESGRLGIPATISTDPRNLIRSLLGASLKAGAFSKWPDSIGMAATRDPELTRQFADIVRQEYLAVGIRQALSPQVDLVGEPRWARISGTYGEDAKLASALGAAYVSGMQHGTQGVDRFGVLAVVKHWVGYGAANDGWDGHSYYGRFANFQGRDIGPHIQPFVGALKAHVSGVMPTYDILEGASHNGHAIEQVGGGFNRYLLTDLLRGEYHYDGVILSDWLITNDCSDACMNGAVPGQTAIVGGMPWGVQQLSPTQRFAKAVNAGVDQFGGVVDSALLVAAVRQGLVTEARMDASVQRILTQKFEQGLFENPYVDPAKARETVGSPAFQAAGDEAQRRSLVLIKNDKRALPLRAGMKIYLHNVDAATVAGYGLQVVSDPKAADIAVVRVAAPAENVHKAYFFGSRQREGRLYYKDGDPDFEEIKRVSSAVPTVVVINLDRPALLANVRSRAAALVADFGSNDGPLFDVLMGKAKPQGKLPFELPSSQAAILAQRSDLPHDSKRPLYPLGFGLTYP